MNGSLVIDALQLLSGALWLTVMGWRAASAWRAVFHHSPSIADAFSLFLVGYGAVQLGFVLRWWLYPNAKVVMAAGELQLWGCLYLASGLLAVASHRLPRDG